MKRNGDYVGVDEKYIPEDEKYVNDSMLGASDEIRDDMRNGVKKIKEYVSDKDTQEKIRNVGKKGLKIAKGFGIGYLVMFGFAGLIFLIAFITIIFTFIKMFGMMG